MSSRLNYSFCSKENRDENPFREIFTLFVVCKQKPVVVQLAWVNMVQLEWFWLTIKLNKARFTERARVILKAIKLAIKKMKRNSHILLSNFTIFTVIYRGCGVNLPLPALFLLFLFCAHAYVYVFVVSYRSGCYSFFLYCFLFCCYKRVVAVAVVVAGSPRRVSKKKRNKATRVCFYYFNCVCFPDI